MPNDQPSSSRIRRLPQHVINRIAAGEVVVRPSAALKELLENSLDAKATQITVTVRDGGLKLLQVTDNGRGVSHSDLPLLCERFATSKISTFEDLRNVATFGFRGEALASISHVARLSVLCKTVDSPVAYSAIYLDGALRESPTACAGVVGTSITVEDLFYNLPTRRAALRSPADEYRNIVDVVARYAVRYPDVAFVCRRYAASAGGGSARAGAPADVRTDMSATSLDNIRAAFGSVVSNETMSFEVDVASASAKASAIVTTANFSMRKGVFVFFINGRLVDCLPLKRAILAAYSSFLPKAGQPFVYIDLTMPQNDIDVNVHPMKKEVRFMHEDDIVEAISGELTTRLKGTETSRTFLTQSILVSNNASSLSMSQDGAKRERPPSFETRAQECKDSETREHAAKPSPPCSRDGAEDDSQAQGHGNSSLDPSLEGEAADLGLRPSASDDLDGTQRPPPAKRVRQTSLDADCPSFSNSAKPSSERRSYAKDKVRTTDRNPVGWMDRFITHSATASRAIDVQARRKRRRTAMPLLTSVEKLLGESRQAMHSGLVQVLKEHVFVGVASSQFSLLQHGTQLMLADVNALLEQLMYQQALQRFADHETFRLEPGAPIRRLLDAYIRERTAAGASVVDCESCMTALLEQAPMIEEYFGISLTGDCSESARLERLPLLFPGVVPDMVYLGHFLYKMIVDTEWSNEEACFKGIASSIGRWYGRHWHPLVYNKKAEEGKQSEEEDEGWDDDDVEWVLRHVLFDAMRSDFYPPRSFFNKNVVREITSTAKLYKIFERC